MAKEMYRKAQECFRKSLEIAPDYALATEALGKLQRLMQ
jgi:hypothetical protein